MLNTIFNHIKNHKLWYGIGTFVVLIALVVVSYNTSSNFKKFSSNLVGNMEFMEIEWMPEMEFFRGEEEMEMMEMEEERGRGEMINEERMEMEEQGGGEMIIEERMNEVIKMEEQGGEEMISEGNNVEYANGPNTSCAFSISQPALYLNAPMPSTGPVYQFDITANGGDVNFTELIFTVKTKGLTTATDDIYNWALHGGTTMTSAIQGQTITGEGMHAKNNNLVNIGNSVIGNGLAKANTTTSGVDDGTYKVIVKLKNKEMISKGIKKTYILRASIEGAVTDNDLAVHLSDIKSMQYKNYLKPATFKQ